MMEMVSQAIAHMGSRKGSSLQAIKKFIQDRFGVDFQSNPNEKSRVSKAIKLGVNRGVFIQEKNSYRLATANNPMMDPSMMQRMPMHGYPQPGMHPMHPMHHHGHPSQQHHGGPHGHHHQQFGMPNQFPNMGYPGMPPHFMHQQHYFHHPHHPQMPPPMPESAPKRKKKKKKKDGIPKRRGAGGLSKPMLLSDELAAVCGGHSMGRTDVVKNLWIYIKSNSLQDPSNKKLIMCDERLRRVFDNLERVDMFTMTKMISNHLTKPDNQDEIAAQLAAQQQQQNFFEQQQHAGFQPDEEDDSDKQHQAQQEQWSC